MLVSRASVPCPAHRRLAAQTRLCACGTRGPAPPWPRSHCSRTHPGAPNHHRPTPHVSPRVMMHWKRCMLPRHVSLRPHICVVYDRFPPFTLSTPPPPFPSAQGGCSSMVPLERELAPLRLARRIAQGLGRTGEGPAAHCPGAGGHSGPNPPSSAVLTRRQQGGDGQCL